MSLPVHLVPSLAGVRAGSVVEITGDEAHHAVAVRRLKVGEQVVLTDGMGTSAPGVVASTGKRVFTVELEGVEYADQPAPALTVVQALPKGDRGELAVEVLTEIGVQTIVPWAAARSVAVWRGERAAKSRAKWQATAREAAKQARRSWFPEVTELADTTTVLELLRDADVAVVLHEDATTPLADIDLAELDLADIHRAGPVPATPDPDGRTTATSRIALVVGPEGGISPEELGLFTAAGVTPVRMGAEVLRTSTAGVAAAAALLSRTQRWG